MIRTEPKLKINQWAAELASVIAFLETLGLAHGDLRPENILLDGEDHIKLADFDNNAHFGSSFDGNAPPWAHLRGREAGDQRNTWGDHGARTEQFAFGSILYTLTRGYEPYEFETRGLGTVDKLRDMIFPELSDDPIDRIIDKCWKGSFASLRDLEAETAELHSKGSVPCMLDFDALEAHRQYCREAYKSLHCHEPIRKPTSPYQPPELCLQQHEDPR